MPSFRYVVADVFTDTPLTGNQLAVFTDAREIPEEQLGPLAREMAFSETVFVYPPEQGGHVRIRIFTPANEVPFAGHPVLGSAFVLAGPLQLGEILIETGVGTVAVVLERERDRLVFGRMSQPITDRGAVPARPDACSTSLGVERSELPVEIYDNGMPQVFVAARGRGGSGALAPDMGALAQLQHEEMATIGGVNCFAGSGRRWKTRMFSPADGVAEDPATGSAAGPLACHLARHGLIAFGDEVEISQGVELARPSTLYARVEGSAERIERVEVGGIGGRGRPRRVPPLAQDSRDVVRAARAPLRERRVGLRRRARLRLDAGAVAKRKLGARVDGLFLGDARARHEDDTRALARSDEDVLGARRAVDEVPGPQAALLALDQEQTLAGEDEEVLLGVLAVVHAVRLPRREDGDRVADLGEGGLVPLEDARRAERVAA